MKIAILSPFYPFRGGIAQFSTRLYLELFNKKNQVKAYSFSTLYPNILFPGKTQLVTEEDTAIKIDNEQTLNTINPLTYYTTAQEVNKYSPDVLIVAYWMPFFAPAFGTLCRFLDKQIKVVALVHNALPHERSIIDKSFASYFFNRCDAFVTLSEPVKNDLLSLRSDAKILLTPHPIYDHYGSIIPRLEACRLLNIDSRKKVLLFFGFIREYKGLDILIKAMDYLDASYQLIIAGECYGSFDKYAKLIEASALKSSITIYNEYIDDEMVRILFSSANLLVLPYRSATQSGVAPLAYHFEVPMIATNVGALKDTIEGSGLIVRPEDSKSLAEGICIFFQENKAENCISNIQQEKKRLSWENFASNLLSFIS